VQCPTLWGVVLEEGREGEGDPSTFQVDKI